MGAGCSGDLPSKSAIVEYWRDRLVSIGIFVDWGEPSCWAWGQHYDDKYDVKSPEAEWNEILHYWERAPYQRCHIIPRSLDGGDCAANLFLMCRECHDAAPNTSVPGIFFKWARSQSFLQREFEKMQVALKIFEFEGEIESVVELLNSPEFKAWVRGKYTTHWPQSGYAPRSSRLTYATLIGLFAQYKSLPENDTIT